MLTNGNMTPNCLLLNNQSETFLVQILIYKNRILNRIIREDEKNDQEETQDCQRSISSILDPRHSEQPSDFTKIQIPDFRDISVNLTATHRHTSSLDILSSSSCQESKHRLLVIYCLTNVFQ